MKTIKSILNTEVIKDGRHSTDNRHDSAVYTSSVLAGNRESVCSGIPRYVRGWTVK